MAQAGLVLASLLVGLGCGAPDDALPRESEDESWSAEPSPLDGGERVGELDAGASPLGEEDLLLGDDGDAEPEHDPGTGLLLGDPIEAPPYEWTWIDFPESRCGDGSPTGLGVNLAPGAGTVLIFLEGGGACWDYSSCFGIVQTSLHLGGFDARRFEGVIASVYREGLLFDRGAERNALADAHHVFVPYCTGDAFSGDAVVEMEGALPWANGTIHFAGHRNVMAYLERLVPTFADVEKVVLVGSSAGGFGAGLSWPYFQQAFGEIRVDVLDDSGPPIPPGDGLWGSWVETWNVQLPDDCVGCRESVEAVVGYFETTLFRSGRFGLVSHTNDLVISTFFDLRPAVFERELLALADRLEGHDQAQVFLLDGVTHATLVMNAQRHRAVDGFPLWQWIEQMVTDDPDWASHRP